MLTIAEYEITGELYQESKTTLFHGVHSTTKVNVMIKTFKSDFPLMEDKRRLKREYDIARSLTVEGVIKVLDLIPYKNSHALILEDFAGETLDLLLKKKHMGIALFLKISVRLALIVDQLHRNKIIHKDIIPKNIIVHSDYHTIKLTDFGIASLFSNETQEPLAPNKLEGTLTHMSPEQTGRMNRQIDFRSDIYTLGVTLYEMLTGQLPFQTNNPMELIYCHIAIKTVSPDQLNDSIPQPLADIVMKCLAKNAEDRYQSAYGLYTDLVRCNKEYLQYGNISPFDLGLEDTVHTLLIPQKLYGRAKELGQLFAAYKRSIHGQCECLMVSGGAGMGKSTFIHEIMQSITKDGGFYITGKFDSLKKHIPYSGLIQAFRQLIRQLASEDETNVEEWRQAILHAVGGNGQVLTELLPELEWIIGPQAAVELLHATETANRFRYVIRNFIECIINQGHTFVIFLDDLQWSDPNSLQLIGFLVAEAPIPGLLFIGAYRNNTVQDVHVLQGLLEKLAQTTTLQTIDLVPMEHAQVQEMLLETFKCKPEAGLELTEVVLNKTGGVPLFIKQFILELHERKLLWYSFEIKAWEWDIITITQMKVNDVVIDLIMEKVDRLSPGARYALQLASCIGYQFELSLVASLAKFSGTQTATVLWEAIEAHLVVPVGTNFKWIYNDFSFEESTEEQKPIYFVFLHDKIREFCYSLASRKDMKRMHIQLGRLLLSKLQNDHDELLFEIVNHYNAGIDEIIHPEEREQLAKLNLLAGNKAKSSTAYTSAVGFFDNGVQLLSEFCWERQYELAFSLYLGKMESEYLSGTFQEAKVLFELLVAKAKTHLDQAKAYNLMVVLYTHLGFYEMAVEIGMEGLRLFGLHLSSSPGRMDILLAMAKIKWRMRLKNTDDLFHLPGLSDAEQGQLVKLAMNVGTPCYFINPDLYLLTVLEIVNLSLKYGNTIESSNAYNAYGLLLGSGFGNYNAGFKLGELGLRLSDYYNHPALRCKCNFTFAAFINHWKRHVKTGIEYLWESFHAGIQAGDLVFAVYAVTYALLSRDFQGAQLDQLQEEIQIHLPFIRQSKNSDTLYMLELVLQVINNLQGNSQTPFIFAESAEAEVVFVNRIQATNNKVLLQVFYMKKMKLFYLFHDYEQALEMALLSHSLISASFGLFHTVEHYFYYALTLAELISQEKNAVRKRNHIRMLNKHCQKMSKWARNCPDNYRHLYLLIKAEYYRVLEHEVKAEKCYLKSIQAAYSQEFVQFAAIAAERLALFYVAQNQLQVARTYMTQAYYTYIQWGAWSKAKHLEQKYRTLLFMSGGYSLLPEKAPKASAPLPSNTMDIAAIVQASQMISSQIVLEQLLQELMGIVMQTTGATRGLLLMKEKGRFIVEAEADISVMKEEQIQVLQAIPTEDYGKMPQSLINYVARTLEHILLDNAWQEGTFFNDPYILSQQLKSVFCLPVMYQGNLIAILYLENQMTTYAFTEERRRITEILSAQVAISIENAKLYHKMEEKVKNRTDKIMKMDLARRNLLSNISHDLGTPLTSIQGYVEAILDGVVQEPELQKKYLKVVHARVLSIQRLMKDLNQLSKMETRLISFNKNLYAVLPFFKQLFSEYELDVAQAKLQYELIIGKGLAIQNSDLHHGIESLYMNIDAERIGQVYSNLIYNAIRHTPQGGFIQVLVDLEIDGRTLIIQICDNGSGIAEDDLPFIFDRFYRGSKSRNSADGGSGLGLAIAKQIIQIHEGEIGVKSIINQGSQFYFKIPVLS